MPRIAKPENAKGRLATEAWRTRLREQRQPEVDAVDTALAAAVSVYMHTAVQASSERDVRKASALEIMAVNFLVSNGSSREQAERVVRRRVRRLNVRKLIPLVGTK